MGTADERGWTRMMRDFEPVEWDYLTRIDCDKLIQLALREDLGDRGDITSLAVVGREGSGAARIVAREAGVMAGIMCVNRVIGVAGAAVQFTPSIEDGEEFDEMAPLGLLEGNAYDILRYERTILNLLGRLIGVATLTQRYVEAIAGTGAEVYDTRKTTPGWRRLEKYAVGCGGGRNHRSGLDAAILIKDNHLALAQQAELSVADAVRKVREETILCGVIEVEVDTLDQLRDVLPAEPDIVLLDNMPPQTLREAVAIRDAEGPGIVLEASGGVRLGTIREIAETGVERISVGALTHQATSLDVGLDWVR